MRRSGLLALAVLFIAPAVYALDLTPPVLTLPSSITVEANGPLTSVNFTATAVDAVDGPLAVVCVPPSNSLFALGVTPVLCTAVDFSGNIATGTFNVTMRDTTGPTILIPPSLTTGATGAAGSTFTYVASAQDAVDGPVPVSCSPASGSFFPVGATTVTCTASDSRGNTRSRSFTVTILDTFPPELTLPGNISVDATSPAGANVTFSVSAVDAVNGDVPVVCSRHSNSLFAIGTTTVTCSASDTRGNTASGAFNVTVNEVVTDTTAPVLSLPQPITVAASGPGGAQVTYSATATDDVDGPVAVNCTPASGSNFTIGTTTVTCRATDAAGNLATGTFTVTVRDNEPPTVVSATASPNLLWPPNHKMVKIDVRVLAFDLADPSVEAHIVEIRSSESDNALGDGNTTGDYRITGPLTCEVRSERSGQAGSRTYTIVVEVSDSLGNTARREVYVRVAKK